MRLPILFLFAVFLCNHFAGTSAAQSSLFNIPTTDIQERGETYIEVDLDSNFSGVREDRWQSFGVMAVRGVSKRFEVGLNAYAVRSADGFEPVEFQPNLKWKVYEGESNGFAVAAGAVAYLPLTKRFHRIASLSMYAVASKEFQHRKAPRISAGAYQLLGSTPEGSSSRGFLAGIEQPLFKRTTFIADWNSGKNRFGYAAVGFSVGLTKRSSIYSAYYFGNEGSGNNYLGIYYSVTL